MTWSYVDPGSSTKDNVRFIIGDTEADFPLLQDAEINFALDISGGHVYKAAESCLGAILAKMAKQVSTTLGPERIDAEKRYNHYKDLLDRIKAERRGHSAYPLGDVSSAATFDVGMHDATHSEVLHGPST